MKEKLIERIKKLSEELKVAQEKLAEFNDEDISKLSQEEYDKYKEEASKAQEECHRIALEIESILDDAKHREEQMVQIREKYTALTIESIGGFEGELEVVESTFEELKLHDKLKERKELEKSFKDKLYKKESELEEEKKQREIDAKLKPVLDFLQSDFEEKDEVVLKCSTYTVTYDDQGPTGSKTVRIPISKARQKLIELSNAGHCYNFRGSHNYTSNPMGDYYNDQMHTTFESEKEVAESEDLDALNALALYKKKVKEVSTNPKYERKITLRIPVYECTSKKYQRYEKVGEVEFTCTEAELARRLGLLISDFVPTLPGTYEFGVKSKTPTEYFEAVNDPKYVEPQEPMYDLPGYAHHDQKPKPRWEEYRPPEAEIAPEPKKPSGLRGLWNAVMGRNKGKNDQNR